MTPWSSSSSIFPSPSSSIYLQTRSHSSTVKSNFLSSLQQMFCKSSLVIVSPPSPASAFSFSGELSFLAFFFLPFPNLPLLPTFFKPRRSLTLSWRFLMTPPILSRTAVIPLSFAFSILSKNAFTSCCFLSSSAFSSSFFFCSAFKAKVLTSLALVSISSPTLSSPLSIIPSPVLSISLNTPTSDLPFSLIMSNIDLITFAVPVSSSIFSRASILSSSSFASLSSFAFSIFASSFLMTSAFKCGLGSHIVLSPFFRLFVLMLPSLPCPLPLPTPENWAKRSINLMPLSFMKFSSFLRASPTSPFSLSASVGSSTFAMASSTSSMESSPSPVGSKYLSNFTTSACVNLAIPSGHFIVLKPDFNSHSVTVPPVPSPKLVSMRSNQSSVLISKIFRALINLLNNSLASRLNFSTAWTLLAFLKALSNSLISIFPSLLGSRYPAIDSISPSLKSNLAVSLASFRALSASSIFFLSLASSFSFISSLPIVISAFLIAAPSSSVSMSPSWSGSRYLMRAAMSSSSRSTSALSQLAISAWSTTPSPDVSSLSNRVLILTLFSFITAFIFLIADRASGAILE
mmetsp:Transcript_19253/g.40138  ORF Transcript_19253/g.40138 Transcript_19253/m.40138 type:complete len:574 (-) Transcript_19253:4281-6002(-)